VGLLLTLENLRIGKIGTEKDTEVKTIATPIKTLRLRPETLVMLTEELVLELSNEEPPEEIPMRERPLIGQFQLA
jgi:hypothetical protein